MKNDRFLRALRREPVDCTPVWLMRQAGRYLPEYRATRAQAGSFLAMAMTPELACEVTLQPLRRFDLDAAILFSDILTVPNAMGLGLYFIDGEGPKFERPVRSPADIDRLAVPDMETELRYVMDAVRLIRRELDGSVPLIGFSGSPWTLACYMVEGGGSKEWGRVKALALNEPAAMHKLLGVVTDAVIAYLSAQRAAGAQALQVFDTWGGTLSPSMYREFSLPYLTRIARAMDSGAPARGSTGSPRTGGDSPRTDTGAHTPLILFGKGNAPHLDALFDSGADAIGVDWTVTLEDAARRANGRVALQGNLDPAMLYGSPDAVRAQVRMALDSYRDGNGGSREGHVFNLGHGMSPDMNPEHVAVLVDEVHRYSAR
ncbi:uroporphyrinogen decarboxylase [Thermomonas sp.]|uniref:uroporphyrinogen decarboxylase n=1 Tax=Thermomonas sp. TaxID=1971895 RepID=UPI002616376E|nr:uroporphyrinogen decarboxylase [Thermomonas sp.]MCO5055682.1 uroporphyrinogen decarboxylase [Thermomonas sp.]